jgi:selenocysteine-specific elongation factor
LRRRGAGAARAAVLSTLDGRPDERSELRRRLLVRRAELSRMGVPSDAAAVTGDWLADPDHWAWVRRRLANEVSQYVRAHPLEPGMPVDALRHALNLPDRTLVEAAVTAPLAVHGGRVCPPGADDALPPALAEAVDKIRADLDGRPFAAPEAARLAELGLGPREIAAAVRAGALERVAGVVLLPGTVERAVEVLAGLAQPFTMSSARQALGTTRRVAVPLLELLDRRGLTRRLPDDSRLVTVRD